MSYNERDIPQWFCLLWIKMVLQAEAFYNPEISPAQGDKGDRDWTKILLMQILNSS